MTSIRRAAIAAASCLNLAGCVTDSQFVATPSPISFDETRQAVLTRRSDIWKDPASIREAKIGQPYACSGGVYYTGENAPTSCVCLEANAKNSFGGYNGVQKTEVLLRGTRVVEALTPPRNGANCAGLTPLPELNGDYAPPAPGANTHRKPKA